nr:adhesion G protein-coupled receptor L4-like isoform X3 [Pocillopora verrucosa]
MAHTSLSPSIAAPLPSPIPLPLSSLSLLTLPSPSPSPSLFPFPLPLPSPSPSPSNSVQKLANEYVSKLGRLDSDRNTSLQEAVNVFENFIVSFENMTKPHEGQFTIDEFQRGRESIFNVAVAFEKFALNYGKHHLPIKIVSHKMVLEVQKAYRQNASDFYFDVHEWQTNINIASSNFADNGSVVVGCVYKNLQDILPKSQPSRNGTGSTRYLGSRIIMAAMEPKPKKLLENVVLKFKNIEIEERVKNCMFWRGFSDSSDGFSDEGCHVVTSRSNSEETVCSCNHLTHFAVLFDYNDGTKLSKQDETVLKTITYIGLSLSIIGMLITSALYFFFTDVRQPLSQIRLSLSVSLGVGQLIFLAGVNATEHTAACIAVAALMQYFLTAAFCWMLVEGIYLYLFVVKVYNINTKMHMYHVISWGLPMIMMAISLGIAAAKEGIQSYVSDKYCWLSSTNNLIWIFVSFVTLIEVLNILIIVRVIKEMTNLVQPTGEDDHIKQIRIGIKACALMIPLLGVTWLFGLLSPVQKAFAYIFTILNSTQQLTSCKLVLSFI